MSLSNNTPSRIREFRHLFAGPRRIVATIRVDLAMIRLQPGSMCCTRCEWEGSKLRQPSAELYPEFRVWMDGVLTSVVEQTGKQLLFVFEPPVEPRVAELWLYALEGPPRLVKTMHNPYGKPLSEALTGMPPEKLGG